LQGQDKKLLKLSVFGRARVMDPDKMSAYLGKNPNWTAPEVFDQARNFFIDVYPSQKKTYYYTYEFWPPLFQSQFSFFLMIGDINGIPRVSCGF
jgi:hypothetical protein